MIKQLLLVALGGGVGSALRYLTSIWTAKQFPYMFPWGTFLVNMLGCFLIGLLVGLSVRTSFFGNELRLLFIVGFCGGYTTFSTFSLENVRMLEAGLYGTLFFYTAGSILLGLLAVLAGNIVSKVIT